VDRGSEPSTTARPAECAIVECLDQVEGKHSSAIASLLRLAFQTFSDPKLLAA
jgi:hypothetical protein